MGNCGEEKNISNSGEVIASLKNQIAELMKGSEILRKEIHRLTEERDALKEENAALWKENRLLKAEIAFPASDEVIVPMNRADTDKEGEEERIPLEDYERVRDDLDACEEALEEREEEIHTLKQSIVNYFLEKYSII